MPQFFNKFELPHYYAVLRGKELPFYLSAKNTFLNETVELKDEKSLLDAQFSLSEKLVKGSLKIEANKDSLSLLQLKFNLLNKWLSECMLCERRCKVDRHKENGVCRVSPFPKIASMFLHIGEEEELVPSLTIFFSGCNFRCVYCQNYDIARYPEEGEFLKPKDLANEIEKFELRGAKNVNFVGGEPTPAAQYIFDVLLHLNSRLSIIWNSNMYHTEELAKILCGAVDLYLADFKYGNDECAFKLSGIKNYFTVVTRNLIYAKRTADVIVRHLVLPGHIECCTEKVITWLKENMPDVNLNVMFQYHPCADAYRFEGLNRRLTIAEMYQVKKIVEESGLKNARAA